jgi:asparagine synthase (glutamine-hydrolysing)
LQRLDRCSMRFGLEAREPFLDPEIAIYALGLGAGDLIGDVNGAPQGKAALRSLWSLYPGEIPEAIRDRRKSPLHVGSGFDRSQKNSPWIDFAEAAISDADFAEGRKRFARFDLRSKEELLYLMKLAECFDVFRVPHLTARPRLRFPAAERQAMVKERLSDFLVEA